MRSIGFGTLGCALLMSVHPLRAQEARLSISVDSVFVGEWFELSVSVASSAGSTVAFQEVPDGDAETGPLLSFGDAEVFSARRLPPRIESGTRVDSLVYTAATFALDNAAVGPVPVDLVVGGDTITVRSNTIALPVRSVLSGDEGELRPPGPPSIFPNPLWVWVLLGLGILLAAGLLFWLWRRSRALGKSVAPRLAPYPEAFQRLAGLAIPQTEPAIKPFYVELSDLLRTYLARTLDVPALELTTRELSDALASNGRVPEAALKDIRGALRVADLVKFADVRPDDEAHTLALRKTREAVDLVEVAARPPDIVPEKPSASVRTDNGQLTRDG